MGSFGILLALLAVAAPAGAAAAAQTAAAATLQASIRHDVQAQPVNVTLYAEALCPYWYVCLM
jgi:predicted secreted protein